MNAASRHASALRRMLVRGGVSVEFVKEHDDYDPATDGHSNDRLTTVSGHVVELNGDPAEYKEMSLVETEPITFLFIPDTLGDEPLKDSQILWNERLYRVRKVRAFRYTGCAVGAKVIAV